ncbi:hypothetical protein [Sporomusa aerivorans]|uniref:hypothetical protein n=1 Tax=Sporomusa aerivorans TaxID=204936 RepID=UPI00352BC491
MATLDTARVFQELLKITNYDNNLVGVGLGHKYIRGSNTGKKSLSILVKKKYPKAELNRGQVIPLRLDDTPTDVIEVGEIKLQKDRREFCRPAQPGMSLGHFKISAGTFGAVVKDKTTGELLILSNNHVLANITNGYDGRANIGDPIIQPGVYDGGKVADCTIGHLHRFVPLYREKTAPHCKIARAFESILNKCIRIFRPEYQVQVLRDSETPNQLDCALAKPLTPELISPDILEFGFINGIAEPRLGLAIKKSGRTTGLTYGQIVATNVTFKVSMNNQEYGLFTDQILTTPMSMPGDSGSLVLTEDNFAVGLLFAGSEQATMLNNIEYVLDRLNITF